MEDTSPVTLWLRRSPGIALIIAIFVYLADVTIEKGVVNQERPHDMKTLARVQSHERIRAQDPEKIFQRMTQEENSRRDRLSQFLIDGLKEEVSARIDEHKAIAERRRGVPKDYKYDLAAYQEEEVDNKLKGLGVELDGTEDKTALYQPSKRYEVLKASKSSTKDLIREHLNHLDQFGWAIDNVLYDKKDPFARISGSLKDWRVAVIIWKKGVFPNYETLVYWKLINRKETGGSDKVEEDQ